MGWCRRVDENGAILMPLVGAIRVQGLTAQQAREAVTRALRERQLAAGQAVTVTLRRKR